MSKFRSGKGCQDCSERKIETISDTDTPDSAFRKLVQVLTEVADVYGTNFVDDALEKTREEYNKRGAASCIGSELRELQDHMEELDGYVSDLMETENDVSEMEDRLAHIEDFLAEKCSGFEPLEDPSGDED